MFWNGNCKYLFYLWFIGHWMKPWGKYPYRIKLTHCGLVLPDGDIKFGSTLTQVMDCCLMAPSHYMNQCWLIIKGVLWHSPVSNFTSAHELNPSHVIRDYTLKITNTSPMGQWVNPRQNIAKLEQVECLRSEDTLHCLMITHTIESYWIPSQNKTKSNLQI